MAYIDNPTNTDSTLKIFDKYIHCPNANPDGIHGHSMTKVADVAIMVNLYKKFIVIIVDSSFPTLSCCI